MIRRLSTFLISLTVCLIATARLAPGTWRQFPVFGSFTDMTDTPSQLYYVTGGSLYAYDKASDETRHFEAGRDLSDYSVDRIFYNFDDRYLLVTFTNGNMDLLFPDGRKVNLPDIKDAAISATKRVNDVKFQDGEIFIATTFGLVIYNGSTFEVKQSGIYNRPVACLAVDKQRIVLFMDDTVDERRQIYAIDHGNRINKLDNFTLVGAERGPITAAASLPGTHPAAGSYYPVVQWGSVRRFDITKGSMANSEIPASGFITTSDGLGFFSTSSPAALYSFNENALPVRTAVIPSLLDGNMLATWDGPSSLWAGAPDGLGNYAVDGGGDLTVKRDKSVPSDAISMTNICRIYPTADRAGFYTANIGQSQTHPQGTADREKTPMEACLKYGETFTPLNPVTTGGETVIAPTAIVEDPDDSSVVFVASTNRGVYAFRDGEEIARIDDTNSPMSKMKNWILAPSSLAIDRFGNLWVGFVTLDSSVPQVMILPREKRRDIASARKEDWLLPDFGSHLCSKDVTVLPCRNTDVVVAYDSKDYSGLVTYYHGGDPTDLSKAAHMDWNRLTDQDGKDFTPEYILSMAEDHNGQVWVGTTTGVFYIPNPTRTFSTDFTINRVKVPRNDGTNLADYLLESDRVSAVAVDNSNRKWFGTESSGLFLTNEDGSEIIARYNTTNSPLPTNCITSIYPDPNSSSVFVGTMAGLLEFASTSGPPRDDYSDVYAYPNPVTPDYSGMITIEGLMGGSMVKIVDAGFNTVYQTMSDGGTAQWDGTNFGGDRVRSGVYYVVASSSTDTSSEGDVVTKILVIN